MHKELRDDLRTWFDAQVAQDDAAGYDGHDFTHFGGYQGYDSLNEILAVASLVREGDAPVASLHRMTVTPSSDSDGQVEGYDIGIDFDWRVLGDIFYLTRFVDWKGTTTDRSATGVEAAWGYLEALVDNWLMLLRAHSAIDAAMSSVPEVVKAELAD